MSETSPAEVVTDGFTDELLKLGFDNQLERFAVLGVEKVAAPAALKPFGKAWQGFKDIKLGKKLTVGGLGKGLGGAFSLAMVPLEGAAEAGKMGRSAIQQRTNQMLTGR